MFNSLNSEAISEGESQSIGLAYFDVLPSLFDNMKFPTQLLADCSP